MSSGGLGGQYYFEKQIQNSILKSVLLFVSSPRCATGFLCNQVYLTRLVVLGKKIIRSNLAGFKNLRGLIKITPVTALCRIKIYRKPGKS